MPRRPVYFVIQGIPTDILSLCAVSLMTRSRKYRGNPLSKPPAFHIPLIGSDSNSPAGSSVWRSKPIAAYSGSSGQVRYNRWSWPRRSGFFRPCSRTGIDSLAENGRIYIPAVCMAVSPHCPLPGNSNSDRRERLCIFRS